MNTREIMHTPYASNEDDISGLRCTPFGPLGNGLPYPEFVSVNSTYASHRPQQSHCPGPVFEWRNDSARLLQPGHHQGFHWQTVSGKQINLDHEPLGKPRATSGGSSLAGCQAHESEREHALSGAGAWVCSDSPETPLRGAEKSILHLSSNSCISTVASGGAGGGKQRIRWTHELHDQFVAAVNSLGGANKATPKGILRLMKSEGLTIFHIKSHLQKYRTVKFMPNFLEGKSGKSINNNGMPISNLRGYGELQISEMLRLQMDVQRSLHEHLEFQKKLQMRIEEHAKYLQRMFEQQKKHCSFFESHNSTRAVNQSVAECSSNGVSENQTEVILAMPET